MDSLTSSSSVSFDLAMVREAQHRLTGVAHRTPLFRSTTLDAQVQAEIYIKAEQLQRTGSFKFRGAYNFLASLSDRQRARGVCTVSSGNHAQALALASQLLDTPMIAYIPSDAPRMKIDAVQAYGATIEYFDRQKVTQTALAARLEAAHRPLYITAHDDPRICAGAGTAALEVIDELGTLDILISPVGGGGGLAGFAGVAKALLPRCAVVGVEPVANGVNQRSLRAGTRVTVPVPQTIADGQTVTTPGHVNFEIMRRTVDDVVVVTDDEIVDAMRYLFERLKIVAEPSGACGFAALLAGHLPVRGKRVGVMVTGGNVDARRFGELVQRSSP